MSRLPTRKAGSIGMGAGRLLDRSFFSGGKGDRSLTEAVQVPEEVYAGLPEPVARVLGLARRPEVRPILLAATYAMLSACLPKVRGQYAGRWYGPQILAGLIAPPGSNKGLASYAVRLCRSVDRQLYEKSKEIIESRVNEGKSAPGFLQPQGLILPADASSAGLLDAIEQSDWPVVLFETEIDSVVGHSGQDWRQLSPLLRKASEHEPLSAIRKGYVVRIERPTVSALLSGTPDQFGRLIPTAEDGLFSRFWWLYTPPTDEWHSPRPQSGEEHPEIMLDAAGGTLCRLYSTLFDREDDLEFKLRDVHWDRLDEAGRFLKERARTSGYGANVDSLVHRFGVSVYRLSMITSLLGHAGEIVQEGKGLSVVTATDDDFDIGLTLALVGLDHGIRLHGILPADNPMSSGRNEDKFKLFEALPGYFDRPTAQATGLEQGLAIRTVDKYLRSFVDDKLAIRRGGGRYAKKSADPSEMPVRERGYDSRI